MNSVISPESEGMPRSGEAISLVSAWHPGGLPPRPTAERAGSATSASGFGSRASHLVAGRLARIVHAGIVEAGELLPSERHLSQAFCVARQTVRSALASLESGLMITLSHGRRARVIGPGRLQPPDFGEVLKKVAERSVHELFEARLAIETQVAALSAALMSPAGLERLQALIDLRRESEGDAAAVGICDFEFHACLHQGSRNELLAGLATDFYCCTAPHARPRGDAQGHHTAGDAQRGCEKIVAALHARDPIAASNAMREHVLKQARNFADTPARTSPVATDLPEVEAAKTNESPAVFWPAFNRTHESNSAAPCA